jgi:succinate dehydrogenase / fumarate reductase, cytochrome b subunit
MAAEYRSRSLVQGLRYKGRTGMWSWVLHRVTGLGLLLFLIVHVADTATVAYWPQFYDTTLELYRSALFRWAELLIVFSVLYHALNGMRIVIQDFWPIAMVHQRRLTTAAIALTVAIIIPIGWIMIAPLFGLRPEPGHERHERRMQERGGYEAAAAPTPAAPAALTLEEGR